MAIAEEVVWWSTG